MNGPLSGVRIVDFTHVLAGPYATAQCALMGADVIRIERPDGSDFIRQNGGTEEMKAAGLGASFLSQNAGKKSVAINLKHPDGKAIALALAATADVVTENFRPGMIDRLGLGYEVVRERRPDIIYASLSGFGPDGPLAGRPAYDHIIQGMSGLMAMTGTPESGPLRVGLPIVDYVSGQALLVAILAALLERARSPGKAQRLHVSMQDAMMTLMGPAAVGHQTAGALRGLEGNRAFSDSPYSGRFDCADGQIVITANTGHQAASLRQVLGRADLADADNATVEAEIRGAFRSASAAEWERRLEEASVPCGRVLTLAEAMDHPQNAFSPAWPKMDVPELHMTVRVPGLSFRAPWQDEDIGTAPALGRDTRAVLADLGLDEARVDALHASGAVGATAFQGQAK